MLFGGEAMLKSVTVFLVAIVMMAGSGCARRVPQPAVKTPGEPLVSWIIMFGDQDNPDREFACQSHPLTACAMPPSRPDAQIVSAVHFYYHGVQTDTNYTGVNKIGFFQGSGGQVQPNLTVKGDEEIVNQSVTGIVTSTPGNYEMSIAVVAASGGSNRQLNDRVRVVVK
jgi:hypothetical protein